jgi:osmoprotectant transport system substrate-binding protein
MRGGCLAHLTSWATDDRSPFARVGTVRQCWWALRERGRHYVVIRRWSAVAAVWLVVVASCADGHDAEAPPSALGDDAITVGSFDFPESVLLAELYSRALEAHGYHVERAFGLGAREFVAPALSAGLIELLPEYAGTAVTFRSLGSVQPSADPATTHEQLVDAFAGSEITVLAAAPAEDANTFVVTPATARSHGLVRLSDLAAVAGDFTFGGPPECSQRPLCLIGLQRRYGVRFDEVVSLDAGGPATRQALDVGTVDVGLLFTTDPALAEYVRLTDDLGLQPAENVTPLLRREVEERWGAEVVEVIDGVSRRLDTDALRRLNAADAEHPGSDDVAAITGSWLRSQGQL